MAVPQRAGPLTIAGARGRRLLRGPLVALVAASALWGGAISGTKFALRGFDPITLLSIELVAATGALWAVLLVRGYRPPRSWRLPVLLGMLEPAVAYLGDTFGLSRTSAANGAVISGLESALVVALAALLLGEAISRAAVIAVALALAGLVVLAGGGAAHGGAVGDLCVAGGALSASAYTVVVKRFDDGSDTLSLTTWQFTVATAVILAVATAGWLHRSERPPLDAPGRYWVAAVLVGLAGFALSFFLYNVAIARVDAGWAAVVLNLIPVFGLVASMTFLGEGLTAGAAAGALLIGVSVVYFTICDRRGAGGSPPAMVTGADAPEAGLRSWPGPAREAPTRGAQPR